MIISSPFQVLVIALPFVLLMLFILGLFYIGPCKSSQVSYEEQQQQDWEDYYDYKHGPRG